MNDLLAQIPLYPTNEGRYTLPGPLGSAGSNSASLLANILSATIGILTVIAAIWFVFKLISGAIGVISAGGDAGKIAKARGDITYALVGLIIIITSTVISNFIFTVLGIPGILNLGPMIDVISPF